MRNLARLQDALVRAVWLVDGVVAVAVVPQAQADTTGREQKDGGGEKMAAGIEAAKEEVVGVALWLPPGQTLDMSLLTFLRAGIVRVLFSLGPFGVKVCRIYWLPRTGYVCNLKITAAANDDRLSACARERSREGIPCSWA